MPDQRSPDTSYIHEIHALDLVEVHQQSHRPVKVPITVTARRQRDEAVIRFEDARRRPKQIQGDVVPPPAID